MDNPHRPSTQPYAPAVRSDELPSGSPLAAYLRAIRVQWIPFTLTILAALGAALVLTATRAQQYEATARVLVSPLPQDDRSFLGAQLIQESGDPTRTVQTAAGLLESSDAATRTAKSLGSGLSAADVAQAVSVDPAGESNILAIRAEAEDPELAARLASLYARSALMAREEAIGPQIDSALQSLEAQRRELQSASSPLASEVATRIVQLRAALANGDPTLAIAQAAAPGTPFGPSRSLVLVLALLAGIALAAATAVLLEMTQTRMRDTDEASALYPLPVLARVPKLPARNRRASANGGVALDEQAQQAFRTVHLQLAEGRRRTILITSASAGDGKTTCAAFLAKSIALAGRRVILMDCDLRTPGAASVLGISPPDTGRAILDGHEKVEELLVHVPDLPLSVLTVGVVPAAPGGLETVVNRLPELLEEAERHADFVVIDTSPLGEVSDTLPLLREVDDVILVTRPGHTDRRTYEGMRDLMGRMGAPVRGLVVIGGPPVKSPYFARADADPLVR
ncbi:MAG: AAA family ATPase [Gemmatimonadota bacterium]|nr:AAA family ATPase [Gemmatimonadota bacterium]